MREGAAMEGMASYPYGPMNLGPFKCCKCSGRSAVQTSVP
jgi:hypothetical protein